MFTNSFIVFFVTLQFANFADPCQTPNGQNGVCKPINQCPSIFALFQNTLSKPTEEFLRKSKCGGSGYPKVCCPIVSDLPPPLPDKSDCGLTAEVKIWGGNKTDIDDHPWLAMLEYRSKSGKRAFRCGGSLISKRYVLTARHCLKKSLFSVRLGEWNTTSNPDCIKYKYGSDCALEVVDVEVEQQIPYADKTSVWNDIGLIRLSEEVKYTEFVRPICLPMAPEDVDRSYLGKKLVVAGWGATENSRSSDVKLQAWIPVRNLSVCEEKTFSGELPLHDGQICAGGEKGIDSCHGDSGGPLMENRNREWYVVGIVSFGALDGCGQKDKPGIYVKVAKYVRWIVDNVKP